MVAAREIPWPLARPARRAGVRYRRGISRLVDVMTCPSIAPAFRALNGQDMFLASEFARLFPVFCLLPADFSATMTTAARIRGKPGVFFQGESGVHYRLGAVQCRAMCGQLGWWSFGLSRGHGPLSRVLAVWRFSYNKGHYQSQTAGLQCSRVSQPVHSLHPFSGSTLMSRFPATFNLPLPC